MQQFLAVAEAGSISSAASQLNVTQPTITVNIRNLEEKYGAPLFERTARGMVLTQIGTVLYDHARIMMRLEHDAQREIERRLSSASEIISLGTGDAWWRLFVNRAIERQHAEKPEAALRIETGSNLQCMWLLLAGEISVAVGHEIPQLDPGLGVEFISLFQARDRCFVAKGHPLYGTETTISALAKYHCVSTVPHSRKLHGFLTSPDDVQQMIKASLPLPNTHCNSLNACIDLVKLSNGYTVFPEDMTLMLKDYGLVPLSLDVALAPKEIGIYFKTELRQSPHSFRLVDYLVAAGQDYSRQRVG